MRETDGMAGLGSATEQTVAHSSGDRVKQQLCRFAVDPALLAMMYMHMCCEDHRPVLGVLVRC